MFTILGADGKEYGPVTAAKISEWMSGGRANLQTKAKRLDETEWKTLADFPEFASPPPAPGLPPVAAGIPAPATPVNAKAYADEINARTAKLDVFGCLGRTFDLWKNNLLPLVGVTLVVLVITMILSAIPFLGAICNLLLNGVFYGGLYYYYLGKLRGEPREFGDAFAGFSKALGPLMLTSLLVMAISVAVALVLLGPWCMAIFFSASHGGQPNPLLFLGMFLCCLPLVYISVAWAFAFILVIDKGLGPWTAMEVSRRVISRQWFQVFFTLFFGVILGMLGLIGLIIGIVFTIPLAIGAMVCAYEETCNSPSVTSADTAEIG